MQGPALHQLLHVPRADVTQTGLQAALLRPLLLQPASQRIYRELYNQTMLKKEPKADMRAERMSEGRNVIQRVKPVPLNQYSSHRCGQVAARSVCERLTAQTGKVLRVSIGQESSQSLLPIVQFTALHYVSPVLGHHWWYQLEKRTNYINFTFRSLFSCDYFNWNTIYDSNVTISALHWFPHHWNAVLLLAQVFLLSFLEQFFSSADREEDGFSVATVIQTQIHSSLKVSHQQRLAYQPISVFKRTRSLAINHASATRTQRQGARYIIRDNV